MVSLGFHIIQAPQSYIRSRKKSVKKLFVKIKTINLFTRMVIFVIKQLHQSHGLYKTDRGHTVVRHLLSLSFKIDVAEEYLS